jgi:iron complex outermembrane recepter protein
MKHPSALPTRFTLFALGLILPAHWGLAQSTTAPVKKIDDEVVALSPFVVNADSEEGYYSPQAVSGTRTRTELIDLPMNMTVFNENFINDIGARDLVDIVSFASGVSGGGTAASDAANGDTLGFILRGQGGFVPNRNGFRRLRTVDPVTISRVEVLKGPSSLLYGQASPGGSVNYITKRPVQRRIMDSTIQVGSYEFYKASVDVNVPTPDKKLAVRFVGSYEDSQSWIARFHNKQTVLYPSVTWWIRPETTLTVEYESTKKRQNPQSSLPFSERLNLNDASNYGALDLSWNGRGRHDYFDVTMGVFTVEFAHKFNEHLTVRANFTDESWEDNVRTNTASATLSSISPPTLPGRTFSRGIRGSWDNYKQVELLNNFEFHKIKVQNLFGYQLGQEKFQQIYSGISPPIDNSALWNLNDPSTWILTERFDDLGSSGTTGQFFRNTINSGYFVNQLTMFDDKLHTLAGLRIDKIKGDNYANANTASPQQSYTNIPTKLSPQVGLLYKLRPGLSAFASYSTSVVNLYTTIARREDGSSFFPVPGTGKGFDYGIKADMMKGKLAGVLSLYSLEEKDIIRILAPVTVNGETFNPSAQSGVNSSTGVELDISARPRKGTQFGLGYAYTYAYVKSDEGTNVVINGVRTLTRDQHQLAYSPHHQISFNFRQDLGSVGPLKNVYVTANGRWVDKRQYTEAWFSFNNQLNKPWMLNSYTEFAAGVGTQFEAFKTKVNASFMVKNLFDERYLTNRNYYGAPRTVLLTFRASF